MNGRCRMCWHWGRLWRGGACYRFPPDRAHGGGQRLQYRYRLPDEGCRYWQERAGRDAGQGGDE